MRTNRRALLAMTTLAMLTPIAVATATAAAKTGGVSWRHFQEERWKIDEAGIKAALDKRGLRLVS